MSPVTLFNLHLQTATLYWEAQTVMMLRMLGMAGAIKPKPGENERMVSEKPQAWMEAWMTGAQAAAAGKSPDVVMAASLSPLTKTVRSNRKRLLR